MDNRIPFVAYPIFDSAKHPFQIDIDGVRNPRGPYAVEKWESTGFIVRVDMPGVPKNGLKTFEKEDRITITFRGTAPKKQNFPFDESERVYAAFVQVNERPDCQIRFEIVGRNGCFLLRFPKNSGSLFFLPAPRSPRPPITSGSSSGKSIDKAQDVPDPINEEAMNLERSERANQDVGCSYWKSQPPKTSHKSRKGSAKTTQGEGSSSGKPIHKTKGSGKFEQGEGSSAKPIDKAEGSGEARSNKSSSYDADDAWMLAWIKKEVYKLAVPKRTEEESVLAETSPTEQSTHEAPEVAIGSIEDCSIHDPDCQCQCCDLYGVCLKTWSTTEDIIIGPVNYLKLMGPDGVCEKRVVQKDGQYSLYVRADLPGLEPHLCVTTARDRCILVYGRPQSTQNHLTEGRSYLFFVKLRCLCCKFDTLLQNHEDGVLRMFCKIIRLEPGRSVS